MKAVVYKGNGRVALEQRPVPVIQSEGDAVVRVTLTTICSSDIHIKHGAVPRAVENTILGHEFVGEVVQIGRLVRRFQPGDQMCIRDRIRLVLEGFAFPRHSDRKWK